MAIVALLTLPLVEGSPESNEPEVPAFAVPSGSGFVTSGLSGYGPVRRAVLRADVAVLVASQGM